MVRILHCPIFNINLILKTKRVSPKRLIKVVKIPADKEEEFWKQIINRKEDIPKPSQPIIRIIKFGKTTSRTILKINKQTNLVKRIINKSFIMYCFEKIKTLKEINIITDINNIPYISKIKEKKRGVEEIL